MVVNPELDHYLFVERCIDVAYLIICVLSPSPCCYQRND